MFAMGAGGVATFFILMGVCLIFAVAWIINSDNKRTILKEEIRNLRTQIESCEREKFILQERVSGAGAVDVELEKINTDSIDKKDDSSILLLQALEHNAELDKENRKIKAELDEARSSLEEIYKAFVDKKV